MLIPNMLTVRNNAWVTLIFFIPNNFDLIVKTKMSGYPHGKNSVKG